MVNKKFDSVILANGTVLIFPLFFSHESTLGSFFYFGRALRDPGLTTRFSYRLIFLFWVEFLDGYV